MIQTQNAAWPFLLDKQENWAYMDNVFTKEECEKIIEIGNRSVLHKANVINNKPDIRDSTVAWLYAVDDMDWAFRRVTDVVMDLNSRYFRFDLFGFTEGFQFTRYDAPQGRYQAHIDKSLYSVIRKLSLTIQLSAPEDYEGGELALRFDDEPVIPTKEQGKLIAFPSYTLHEVKPVTKGTRYSLVAWVTGAPFK